MDSRTETLLKEQLGILLPYQRRWVGDQSRFKIGLMARQTGKSFATSLEAVIDCISYPRNLWVFLSAGERQSLELAEKAKLHCDAISVIAEFVQEAFDVSTKQYVIRFPNGSRIISLPANPNTARGYSGNVLLDEFAFHQDSTEIWGAIFPTVTRNPRFKVRVISTPNGQSGMFWELWKDDDGDWSRHRVDIYQAVEQGLSIDPEALRKGLKKPLKWQQEYLLEFVEENTAWLPYELIAGCESEAASTEGDPSGELYLGMDIGRHRDLSVIWIAEKLGDVLWTRKVVWLERVPFATQREVLYSLLPKVRRAAIDSTGLGMQLAEEAKTKFGSRVEPVMFTNAVKEDLAITLRRRFEDKTIRVPVDERIRESLHAVRRIATSAGNFRFDADRDESGHADEFWAGALAVHAASNPTGPVEWQSAGQSRFGKGAW
jgi:phage FluMu gp28-like protein